MPSERELSVFISFFHRKAARLPRSTSRRISDSTRRIAVSVEWPCRNPDWKHGRRLADERYSVSWSTIEAFYRSFDKTGRFEIATSSRWSHQAPGFLTIGVINASLNVAGK